MLTGSCHCGRVRIEMDRRPRSLTECNCSICRRYGALWAYRTRKSARVLAARGAMSAYLWGERGIEFYHCRTCGCLTHYEQVRKTTDSRLAVNARMLDPNDIASARIRRFDGAKSWRYLD